MTSTGGDVNGEVTVDGEGTVSLRQECSRTFHSRDDRPPELFFVEEDRTLLCESREGPLRIGTTFPALQLALVGP